MKPSNFGKHFILSAHVGFSGFSRAYKPRTASDSHTGQQVQITQSVFECVRCFPFLLFVAFLHMSSMISYFNTLLEICRM